MFDYTLSAIEIVLKDLKKLAFIVTLITCGIMSAYYIYASVVGIGRLYITIPMASLSFLYLVFLIVISRMQHPKVKKFVTNSYKVAKMGINAVALSFTIYEIYLASNSVKPLSIILASLSSILYVVTLIFNIVIWILEPRARILAAGIMKDMEDSIFPKLNLMKSIKGEEKLSFDLTPYERELKLLEPFADEKRKQRKRASSETWDRRIPIRKLFRRKPKKNDIGEGEGE